MRMSVTLCLAICLLSPGLAFGQTVLAPGDIGFVGFESANMFTTSPASGVVTTINSGGFGGGTSQSILWHPGYPDSYFVGGFGFVGRMDFLPGGGTSYTLLTTAIGTASQMSVDASSQIIVADAGTNQIVSMDPATGAVTPITSGAQPWGSTLNAGAVDPSTGDYYAGANNMMFRIPAGTTTALPFTSGWSAGTSYVSGIAFHPATGVLHATLLSVSRVVSIDSMGNLTDVIPPNVLNAPNSLAFNAGTTDLYVGWSGGRIDRIIGGLFFPEVSSSPAASVAGVAVVGTSGPSLPTVTMYGSGCGGAMLSSTSVPALGGFFPVDLTGGTANSQAYLFLALGKLDPGQPLGGGCSLYLEPNSMLLAISLGVSPIGPLPTSAAGSSTFPLTIPSDPGAAGTHVYLQGATVDGSSPIGVLLTNGLDALLN